MAEGLIWLVAFCVALAGILRWLLPTPEARAAFWRLLFKRFAAKPVVAPPPKREPKPGPELEPEIGNVRPVRDEWEQEPDVSKAYQFPDRIPPVTSYEDLNRRLFVFTEADTELRGKRLPPRDIDDHPTVVRCKLDALTSAMKSELRCAYPVVLDPLGLFAGASRSLERNPYFSDPVIDAYLKIPEQKRPAVISWSQPQDTDKTLIFVRYRFRNFPLDPAFLNPYPEDSIAHVFEQFLAAREVWLWFSRARLRKHATDLHKPMEEAKAQLAEILETNNFARLWKLRAAQPAQAISTAVIVPEEPVPSAAEAADPVQG